MVWSITAILVMLWLLGFVAYHIVVPGIHILLVVAIIVVIFGMILGKGRT
jgi:hypothetical protein